MGVSFQLIVGEQWINSSIAPGNWMDSCECSTERILKKRRIQGLSNGIMVK
jgi:hypothetical protein